MIVWQDKENDTKIDALTRLVPKKQFDLLTLDHLCREYDGTFSRAEIEPGFKPDRHFRSFFLFYEGKRLMGELFIFPVPDENGQIKAEITAIVDPQRRRNGIFTRLLEAAEEDLEKYGIEDYVFVAEPGCEDTDAVRAHKGFNIIRSELIMELPRDTEVYSSETIPSDKTENDGFSVHFDKTAEGFTAILDNMATGESIGKAHLCLLTDSAFIFGVEIDEGFRNKGLGKALMKAVIEKARTDHPTLKIMLQVSSDNVAAVALYKGLGFAVSSSLDYIDGNP